ncbi:MAG: phenylalanine--tRNA ligase subunit beta [Candidatus Gastranaerophilales bacterium]|nr:phenylalanine--tRNA ligase subunit beta [Candidatus Gastranaerophilales bacterium]
MQVSYEWLNDYVDLEGISPEEIAHALTMSGLEVEEVEEIKPKFTNILTAKIEKIENHPNADKLHLVSLSNKKTVVCGAQNIKEGQIVPYASTGSKVLNRKTGEQFELVPAIIRGIQSEGMLCSQDELGLNGLQDEDGILILNPDTKLNEPLEKVLKITDEIIFHTAPTANRGDQMSVIGIAREISALFNRKLKFSKMSPQTEKKADFKVEIKNEDACKFYSIGILKDITIKPAPEFIQRRVISGGMRPINNVVDITNYVMLEYGTPLHAFDYDKLDKYLCVRYAKNGEKITTLDNVERTMTDKTVVIAKKDVPVCLGGVFGGNNSEIDENTKNLALEAAFFTSHTNRKSARSVGYRSEASARYERGVDIGMVEQGLYQAVNLLIKYADAKFEGISKTGSDILEPIHITLRNSEIKRVLGSEIEQSKSIQILENLGFKLLGKNEAAAKFEVPTYRMNDVYREIDLIEEVSRIDGYEKIPPTLPDISSGAVISDETKTIKLINSLFLGNGFSEIVTTTLTGDNFVKEFMTKLDDNSRIDVINPQSEDATTLRQELMPNMLAVVKNNYDNGNKNFKLYEIGKTFKAIKTPDEDFSGALESRKIAGCIFGHTNNEFWNKKQNADFYTIKGILENLFEVLGLTKRIVFSPLKEDKKFMHPYISATVELLGKNPVNIGYAGKIHPVLSDKLKFNQDLYVFEIDLEEILKNVKPITAHYKKLPQTSPVLRDIAFIADEETTNALILKTIKKGADKNIFKSAHLFDVYRGENIGGGKKSLAYRIILQDDIKTLTDIEIEAEINNIKTALVKNIQGVVLR